MYLRTPLCKNFPEITPLPRIYPSGPVYLEFGLSSHCKTSTPLYPRTLFQPVTSLLAADR